MSLGTCNTHLLKTYEFQCYIIKNMIAFLTKYWNGKALANSVDPNQTQRSVSSEQTLPSNAVSF